MSEPYILEVSKIKQHRVRQYAKINFDAQFILPRDHRNGSTDGSFDGTANANSHNPIDVETINLDLTSIDDNQQFYLAFVIIFLFYYSFFHVPLFTH